MTFILLEQLPTNSHLAFIPSRQIGPPRRICYADGVIKDISRILEDGKVSDTILCARSPQGPGIWVANLIWANPR